MRPRKGSESTRGECIKDDALREGYLVDKKGRIVGEARRYDPYSRFGEIMLYEIDSFGFCPGYITVDWSLMSEEDLKADKTLRKELEKTQYEVWKRHNLPELNERWNNIKNPKWKDFEDFCKFHYNCLDYH